MGGSGALMQYPNPKISHRVPETGDLWDNIYIDFRGAEAMSVTFPNYVDLMTSLGAQMRLAEEAST